MRWVFAAGPLRKPVADLSTTRTVGTQAIGDVGALIWVAVGRGGGHPTGVLARTQAGPGGVSEWAVPRLSCLPSLEFSGQAYHRVAGQVPDKQLE
jgi:hypothetical protein